MGRREESRVDPSVRKVLHRGYGVTRPDVSEGTTHRMYLTRTEERGPSRHEDSRPYGNTDKPLNFFDSPSPTEDGQIRGSSGHRPGPPTTLSTPSNRFRRTSLLQEQTPSLEGGRGVRTGAWTSDTSSKPPSTPGVYTDWSRTTHWTTPDWDCSCTSRPRSCWHRRENGNLGSTTGSRRCSC